MITFTALDSGIRVSNGDATMVVYPAPETKPDGAFLLLAVPQEEPEKDKISWSGEYNMKGITLRGIAHLEGQQTSFVTRLDGVRIAFLSAPLQEWTDEQISAVGDIDVLVLPMQN